MSMTPADKVVKRSIRKSIKDFLERNVTDDFQMFNKYKLAMSVEYDDEYVGTMNRFCANSWHKIKVLKSLLTVYVMAFEKVGTNTYCVIMPTTCRCFYFDEHNVKVRRYAEKIVKICRDWSKETCVSKLSATITYDRSKAIAQDNDFITLDVKVTDVYEAISHKHNVAFSDIKLDKEDKNNLTCVLESIRRNIRGKHFNIYIRPKVSSDSGWWIKHTQIVEDLEWDKYENLVVICRSNYELLVSDRMNNLKQMIRG